MVLSEIGIGAWLSRGHNSLFGCFDPQFDPLAPPPGARPGPRRRLQAQSERPSHAHARATAAAQVNICGPLPGGSPPFAARAAREKKGKKK